MFTERIGQMGIVALFATTALTAITGVDKQVLMKQRITIIIINYIWNPAA